jgi:hypothetical protein
MIESRRMEGGTSHIRRPLSTINVVWLKNIRDRKISSSVTPPGGRFLEHAKVCDLLYPSIGFQGYITSCLIHDQDLPLPQHSSR